MPEQENHADETKISFIDQFESLEIPPNIDPRLLELWLYREREEIESKKNAPETPPQKHGRKLTWLFAAYIGILVMCLTIALGLIQGKEMNEILERTCQIFLIYTVIGFFVGWIIEYCVTDSVETMLREIVRRSDDAAFTDRQNKVETTSDESPVTVEE